MISGGIDVDRPVCERYALDLDCTVASGQYRLAPEDPYPAGVEDWYAALVWAARHAGELGIDARRVAMGGESAGAGLAAATALLARDRKGPELVFQALTHPMLDDRNNTPSARAFQDIPSWSRQHNDSAWKAVIRTESRQPGRGAVRRARPRRRPLRSSARPDPGRRTRRSRLQPLMKHDCRRRAAGRPGVSRATTYETR
ncbi:hypothetical protein SHO565_77980 [Streptomyces sp. HO565]